MCVIFWKGVVLFTLKLKKRKKNSMMNNKTTNMLIFLRFVPRVCKYLSVKIYITPCIVCGADRLVIVTVESWKPFVIFPDEIHADMIKLCYFWWTSRPIDANENICVLVQQKNCLWWINDCEKHLRWKHSSSEIRK